MSLPCHFARGRASNEVKSMEELRRGDTRYISPVCPLRAHTASEGRTAAELWPNST